MDYARPYVARFSVIFAVMCLFLAFAGNSVAQTRQPTRGPGDQARRLTLDQAVAIAQNRNLQLVDSRLAAQEKEYQRREAYSDMFPQIDVNYVGNWNRYRQEGNIQQFAGSHDSRWTMRALYPGFPSTVWWQPDYPYRIDPYRTFSLSVTITQPLYTGGKLINEYKYARLGVDYAEIQVEVTRQDLILNVTEAYYQIIQAEKLLDVAEQSIRALEALRNQTREFYKAGVVPKVDVLSTEGQLAQAQIQRTQSLTDIQKFTATLNYLLRFPQETPIRVVQDIDYRPNSYRIPDIYAAAAGNRLEIRQASITVEQAMALVKSSRADLIPSVSVQAQAARLNDDWNPLDREAVNSWSLQGVLSWSFDMFRRRETVKERVTGEARAFVARELLVEQIMEEVKQSYEDMKRAESDIRDNQKAVEFRRENFRINQERYKEQVATYIEVLDAQRQLSQAEGDYYISLVAYWINRAVLQRKMGVLR
jgi:outer membrane protein